MESPTEIDLFEAALALHSSDEQNRFLDSACEGLPELRSQLDRLLKVHHAAELFFEEARPDGLESRPTPALLAPTKIGNYQLLSKLGEGGWGVVYRAIQECPVRREVAVKVIKLGMDTRAVVARFEAERQALAMMDHPNIARVLDAGATESGRPFFVMELVAGIRITDFCDQQKLSIARRIRLFLQVCHGVQHAHQKGVIHRDLKPSNVLVAVHDDTPQAKIIDFGIAKATGEVRLSDRTAVTEFHQTVGTPAYMSPEQSGLGSRSVDTRSDIYSLGVILFELLIGQTPVPSGGLQQNSLPVEDDPIPPSTCLTRTDRANQDFQAGLRQLTTDRLRTTLRGDLDWVVLRCLAIEPDRRYQTVKELSQDLERFLDSEPVSARPPTRIYRVRKLYARHRLFFLGIGGISLVLLLASATSIRMYLRERSAREAARVEALRSATVAQFLKQMFTGLRPSASRGRDTALLRDILERAAERMTHDLKDQPEVEAELRSTLGKAYEEVGSLDKSVEEYRRALQLRLLHFGPNHRLVASSLNDLSGVLYATAKFDEAETNILAALSLARTLGGEDDPLAVAALSRLSVLRHRQGREEEAIALARRVVAFHRHQAPPNQAELARALSNLAFVLNKPEQLVEAEQLTREALAIERQELPEGDPGLVITLTNLGEVNTELGRLEDAEKFTREAIELGIKFNGKSHGTTMWGYEALSQILRLKHRWQELVELRRLIFELSSEKSMSTFLSSYYGLERVILDFSAAGRDDLLEEFLAKLLKRPDVNESDRAFVLAGRGFWEAKRGLWSQSMATLREATQLNSHCVSAASDLALLLVEQGRREEYLQWVELHADRMEPSVQPVATSMEVYEFLLLPDMGRHSSKALPIMEKVRTWDPHSPNQPLVEWTYGLLKYRMGEFKDSEAVSRRILETAGLPLGKRLLADLLGINSRLRLGFKEEARKQFANLEPQLAIYCSSKPVEDQEFGWRIQRLISILTKETRQNIAALVREEHQSKP
jgi:serine/threonine protein kinase/Flp pilus assembly protein TadD